MPVSKRLRLSCQGSLLSVAALVAESPFRYLSLQCRRPSLSRDADDFDDAVAYAIRKSAVPEIAWANMSFQTRGTQKHVVVDRDPTKIWLFCNCPFGYLLGCKLRLFRAYTTLRLNTTADVGHDVRYGLCWHNVEIRLKLDSPPADIGTFQLRLTYW